MKEQIPFAVVGSDRYVSVGSKNVLGRKTKWGIIEGVCKQLLVTVEYFLFDI